MNEQTDATITSARKRRYHRLPLVILVVILGGLLLFGGDIRRWVLRETLLRVEAPNRDSLHQCFAESRQPAALLRRCWATGKLPHRLLTMEYLRTCDTTQPKLIQQMRPLLFEAAQDTDLEIRAIAYSLLLPQPPTEILTLLRHHLSEPDAPARLLAVRTLHHTTATNLLPLVAALLSDSDLGVANASAILLQKWTGQNFGLRLYLTLPDHHTGQIPPTNFALLTDGLTKCRAWWNQNKPKYPPPPPEAIFLMRPPYLSAPDFTVQTEKGMKVSLSELRGKPVLLVFFQTDSPGWISESNELVALQRRLAGRLAILASLPSPRWTQATHVFERWVESV